MASSEGNSKRTAASLAAVLLLAGCGPTFAQGPAPESDALAARFPDPVLTYRTPAFEPGHEGVTSNAELRALAPDRTAYRLDVETMKIERVSEGVNVVARPD